MKKLPVVVLSLCMALGAVGSAFAAETSNGDAMAPKDSMMKKDAMSKDSMSKDSMSKDAMKKKDGMSKDAMSKDSMMKKDATSKDEAKDPMSH